MEIKAIFGILSAVLVLLGGIPYIINIHRNKIQPHILSWIGWAFITALGAFAMLASGSEWTVAILFANTVSCLIIVIYSILKKNGVWSTSIYDFIFFSLGMLGLVLWQTLNLPILAIICAIIADFSFGLPTIIKTFKSSKSETYFAWSFFVISGLLSLFAVKSFIFSDLAYPLYLFLFDSVVLLLVLGIIHKKNIINNTNI
ncbi:hypothetical protein K8R66_00060 [bacterium]|nr:hypothetical protein [bacterium]